MEGKEFFQKDCLIIFLPHYARKKRAKIHVCSIHFGVIINIRISDSTKYFLTLKLNNMINHTSIVPMRTSKGGFKFDVEILVGGSSL